MDGLTRRLRAAGADLAEFLQERPGLSTFVLSDGDVYHTYSAYARGLDGLWGAYQWMDRAPFGAMATTTPGYGTTSTPE